MTKYEQIINKIRTIKFSTEGNPCPNYNADILNQAELELIAEALETIQFLEIVFKARKEKQESHA